MKSTFSATLLKVEKADGKLPKVAIEVIGEGRERTSAHIAAELMEFSGQVIITIEKAQMSLDEEDEPEVAEGQLTVEINAATGEILEDSLLEQTSDSLMDDADPQPEEKVTIEEPYEVEGVTAVIDEVPFEPTPEEIEETTPEEQAFRMESPTQLTNKRLWPTIADLLITAVDDGQIPVRTIDGTRITAYLKDDYLTLEVEDIGPDALADALVFFEAAGGMEFSITVVGKSTIFTEAK